MVRSTNYEIIVSTSHQTIDKINMKSTEYLEKKNFFLMLISKY